MIELLLNNAWLSGVIAIIFGAVFAYFKGKSDGKNIEVIKHAEKQIEESKKELKELEELEKAVYDAEKETNKLDGSAIADRLRDRWTRD